nr:hypothetical protein [Halococcus salsus]
MKSAATRAVDRTGNDDSRKVSSHDLRRHFAHSCLVCERMNPRVVMGIGGWDNYQSFELYLNKLSIEAIVAEFAHASIV